MSDRQAQEDVAGLTSRRVVARSAGWRLLEVAGSEALSFGFMVLLARILGPQDYGVVAIAGFVIVSCQLLLTRGIPEAIVQRRDLSPEHLDSGFWANVLFGVGLSLIVLMVAAPSAILLQQPQLRGVLMGLSPLPLLFAAIGVYQARLRRAMQFRSLAVRTQACVLAGGIVGSILAYSGAGFWSLVAQQLSYTATNLVVLILATRWRPRWRLNRAEVRSFYQFGIVVSGRTLLDTLSQSGLPLLVGMHLPASQVGLFFLARRIVFSLSMFTHWSVNELSLPVLSRLSEHPEKHREAVYFCLRIASLITLPAFVGVAVFADPLVHLIFGTAWLNSIETLQILVLAGVLQALPSVSGQIFTSMGQPHLGLQISVGTCLLIVILVSLLAAHGIAAAAAGVAVAYVVAVPLTLMRLRTAVGISMTRLVHDQAMVWGGVALMAVIGRESAAQLSDALPLAWQLSVQLSFWALGTAAIVFAALPEAREIFGKMLFRPQGSR